MDEFKLNFYYNIYKDKPISTREEFRIKFKKLHGEFNYVNELIVMIEKHQLKKYGTTLYEFGDNENKREAFCTQRNRELRILKNGGKYEKKKSKHRNNSI